jgi:hypothetical protein
MLTATVTAMSMIEATTGLRAFLLFNIFIFFHIPPFRVSEYVSRSHAFKSYDLIHHITHLQNKTTADRNQIASRSDVETSKSEV